MLELFGEEREWDSNDAQVVRRISGPQGTFSPDKILPALVWKQKFIVTYVEFSDFFFYYLTMEIMTD